MYIYLKFFINYICIFINGQQFVFCFLLRGNTLMSSDKQVPEMPIKEAATYFVANANLQIEGVDMAIPYVVGDPGIGKTRFLEYECQRLGFGFVPFHFSLIPIEEIGGLPVFKKTEYENTEINGTEWSLPDIMTKIYEAANKFKKVIVFLDDFHMCSPAHLSLGYEMFTEKKLRGYKFPKNTAFILAGNDSVKSGSKQMFGAIVNRVCMQRVVPHFDQWMMEYAIPSKINPKIISFLKNQINRSYFLGEESTNEPWPSPRSWSRFSEMLNAMEQYIPSIDINKIMYIAYGHVGPKAASEFAAYYDIYSKTEMGLIFDGKKDIIIPSNNTDMYIYGMSASNEYVNRIVENNTNNITKTSKTNLQRDSAIKTIATIITKIGASNIEIAVALLKNISEYEMALGKNNTREKLYLDKVLEEIKNEDKEIDTKLTKSLTDILLALS